jgi:HTH-type transcriptional regulator/antitoxin HigA
MPRPVLFTVAGVLEVEMFKRHLRQRAMAQLLEMPKTRLSEIIRGKLAMNLDFARRLHERLGVPAKWCYNCATWPSRI